MIKSCRLCGYPVQLIRWKGCWTNYGQVSKTSSNYGIPDYAPIDLRNEEPGLILEVRVYPLSLQLKGKFVYSLIVIFNRETYMIVRSVEEQGVQVICKRVTVQAELVRSANRPTTSLPLEINAMNAIYTLSQIRDK